MIDKWWTSEKRFINKKGEKQKKRSKKGKNSSEIKRSKKGKRYDKFHDQFRENLREK